MSPKKPTKPAPRSVSRSSASDPTPKPVGHPRIARLEVESGFLDGLKVDFTPHLNCLIGEKGTGKTTVLEFLRFALKGESEAKRLKGLLKGNLGNGLVRVVVDTREGLRLTVEREGGGAQARVLDREGNEAPFTLEHGVLFDCDVYGQDEIEAIASSPGRQLELIDRFAQVDVRALQGEIRRVTGELRSNAHEILGLEEKCGDLEQSTGDLAELKEKLASMEATASDASLEALNREVELKGRRDRELRSTDLVRRFLDARREALLRERAALSLGADLMPLEDGSSLPSPNLAHLEAIQAVLDRAREAVREAITQAIGAVDAAGSEVESLKRQLAADHQAQEARYREVMAAHEAERGRATERVELQRRLNVALEHDRALKAHGDLATALRRRRKELLLELQRLRRDRYERRCQVAAFLTQELGSTITVEVTEAGDTSAYEALLAQALSGFQKQVQALAKGISERIVPRDLVRLVQGDQAETFATRSGLSGKKAQQVIDHLLRSGELLYQLEVVETEDVPRITFLDEQKPKELSTLSTGQKCTTVLPILLLEEERPLLIDQPEDNLDNRYVSAVIVETLRQVKVRRQLIFVTHNANIPVLGDAERVVVMRSRGDRAYAEQVGTVDEVKDHAEKILEGGAEAFEARRRRYRRG